MKIWHKYPLFGGLIGLTMAAAVITALVLFPVGLPLLSLVLISTAVGLGAGLAGSLFGRIFAVIKVNRYEARVEEDLRQSALNFASTHDELFHGKTSGTVMQDSTSEEDNIFVSPRPYRRN
jgi:uncharacterized membrane protein